MNLFIIAKGNVRKKKSHLFILLILVTISTMVLYTGIHVLTKVNGFLDEKNEERKGAHVVLTSATGYDDEIVRMFRGIEGYDSSEMEDYVHCTNAAYRNVTQQGEKESMEMSLFNLEWERDISRLLPIDESGQIQKDSIVLPAYLKTAKGYHTGDIVEVSLGNKSYTFKIYGFSEDVMFATPNNIAILKCYVSKEAFQELSKDSTRIINRNYNVRLKEGCSTEEYEQSLTKAVSEQLPDVAARTMVLNYDIMRMGTGYFINMLMVIVSLFGLLLLLVSIIVIRFSIASSMEDDLSSIGMLKASGYTNAQFGMASIIEFEGTALIGVLLGLLLSQASAGFITGQVSASIGLVWKSKFNGMVAVCSALLILGTVLVVTWETSRRFKKITPLTALRNGLESHNFKKNHLPLLKSRLGLNTSIGLKGILQRKKQNTAILLVVALLSFLCVFVVALYYNFVVDTKELVRLVGVEKPNVMVVDTNVWESKGDTRSNTMFDEIDAMSGVKKSLHYNAYNVKLTNQDHEVSLSANVCNDPSALEVDTLIEGRRPKYDNEITLTTSALKRLEANIGDVVYIEEADRRKDFIIVGISQQISNLGLSALLSEEGASRINEDFKREMLYVYLNEGGDVGAFIAELDEKYGEMGMEAINFDDNYQSILSGFTGALTILCVLFIGITVLVIVMILFLMIKMKLLRERKMMGVFKALGYTTKQIIWQNVMSFAPTVSVGGLIGVVLAKLFTSQLFSVMFSFAGIVNSSLYVTMGIMLGTFAAISFLALLAATFSSMGVRKIEPCKMWTEV